MANRYPYYGHDDGLVIDGPDTGFATRRMTPAELAARAPALAIAKDIYRHANQAGICYAEIWHIIAEAIQDALDEHNRIDELLDASKAALHYMRLHKYADQAWADDLERAIARADTAGGSDAGGPQR